MAKRVYRNSFKVKWETTTSDPTSQAGYVSWESRHDGKAATDGRELARYLRKIADAIDGMPTSENTNG